MSHLLITPVYGISAITLSYIVHGITLVLDIIAFIIDLRAHCLSPPSMLDCAVLQLLHIVLLVALVLRATNVSADGQHFLVTCQR